MRKVCSKIKSRRCTKTKKALLKAEDISFKQAQENAKYNEHNNKYLHNPEYGIYGRAKHLVQYACNAQALKDPDIIKAVVRRNNTHDCYEYMSNMGYAEEHLQDVVISDKSSVGDCYRMEVLKLPGAKVKEITKVIAERGSQLDCVVAIEQCSDKNVDVEAMFERAKREEVPEIASRLKKYFPIQYIILDKNYKLENHKVKGIQEENKEIKENKRVEENKKVEEVQEVEEEQENIYN